MNAMDKYDTHFTPTFKDNFHTNLAIIWFDLLFVIQAVTAGLQGGIGWQEAVQELWETFEPLPWPVWVAEQRQGGQHHPRKHT